MPSIELPYEWEPRDYQIPVWEALESGCKRVVLVWHRRAGKDITAVNWCVTQLFERIGLYWHVFPTYGQGRKIAWEGMTKDSRPFIDHIPEQLVTRRRDDEMRVWVRGGSQYQVVGAENPDSLVGANPIGLIVSEWSVMNPQFWTYVRPVLAENGGWVIFIYTPRGRNQGWHTYQHALQDPNWFAQLLTVDDTRAVSKEVLEQERKEMPESIFKQEYYCSFDAPLQGSFFGDEMVAAEKEGRIGRVPHDKRLPVETWWDLGMRDSTVIWFVQRLGPEIRAIDCEARSGVGIDAYVKLLREKPYNYEKHGHLSPHDAEVRELGTGKSRIEVARSLGLHLRIVPKLSLEDGINAVRMLLGRCYFDAEKCATGIEALRQYSKKPIEGVVGPSGEQLYTDQPIHDWTSHYADAFRTGAVGSREPRPRGGDGPPKLYPDLAIV